MDEKAKAKGQPLTRFARVMSILKWGFATVIVCGCCGLALMIAYLSIGTVEPAPSPTLLLTAEYLYEHPQPTIEGVRGNPRASEEGNRICYGDMYAVDDKGQPLVPRPQVSTSDFSINGSRVPPLQLQSGGLNYLTPAKYKALCFDASHLTRGLHLAEIHIRSGDKSFVYQWAVDVGTGAER